MWFPLSLLALAMLVSRRSAEKHATGKINSLALTWLQQATALPFIILTLFFAKFYWPSELSLHYWVIISVYAILISFDTYLYFKALSMADVSYVAPLLTLVALGNIGGAYVVLGQKPTVMGLLGACLIVAGAALTYHAKRKDILNRQANKLVLILVLVLVVVRGLNSNIEVPLLRDSNPTTFNFYSSIISVPLLILTSLVVIATNKTQKYREYWTQVKTDTTKHRWLLAFIGITYTVNMLATYGAKLIGPNAGYIGAVKSASVLPIMLMGLLFFKEKIIGIQWVGLGIIVAGIVLLGLS
ncbi:MAG TPA: EamA family transporter [Patescibacteria group bacterium]|nr:EamA family transporter [Patescibacteria group bacterium]